jgi:hypothetical protein
MALINQNQWLRNGEKMHNYRGEDSGQRVKKEVRFAK